MLFNSTCPIFLGKLLTICKYGATRMASYASQPKHSSTSGMWQYGDGKTQSQLKVATWNVNGFRSIMRKGQLQQYLKSSDPDILCLNQTKMDLDAFLKQKSSISEAIKKSTHNGWFWYWNFCKVSSGYSGVATFSKYKPIAAFQQFELNHHMSLEGRCLTLEFDKFYLVNCYKPNSGSGLERLEQRTEIYDKKLAEFVKNLKAKKTVIICGDMNVAHNQIDLARPKVNKRNAGFTNEERSAFNHFLSQTGAIDSYRYLHQEKVEYTWWSARARARQNNVGWRIDYIMMTDPEILLTARIRGDVMGSDHCPVQCTIKF